MEERRRHASKVAQLEAQLRARADDATFDIFTYRLQLLHSTVSRLSQLSGDAESLELVKHAIALVSRENILIAEERRRVQGDRDSLVEEFYRLEAQRYTVLKERIALSGIQVRGLESLREVEGVEKGNQG